MHKLHPGRTLAAILLITIITACTSAPSDQVFKNYNPANFTDSANIGNLWLPLKPGTQWVFQGYTVENNEQVTHRLVITVTDLIKVIDGVRSAVTYDLDYSADQLVEAELAFFAQDKDGNVWRMGEYPEVYEDGKLVDAPAWIHGIDDALAGIAMVANPQLSNPSYPQGWGPNVDWNDRGQVDQVGVEKCIPLACYENVLVISESSKSEPDAFQLKYYAPNIGNIYVDWRGKDQTQEILELTQVQQLDPITLAEVRAKAMELEAHAYTVSKDVYAKTEPMKSP